VSTIVARHLTVLLSIALLCIVVSVAINVAERPSAQLAAVTVPAGGDLQGAIDRARPGEVILLEPGGLYVGNFTLPQTSGSQYITIRSSAAASRFPIDGRVGPEHARWMPTLRSPNGAAVLSTAPGAHHWRLQWLAFQSNVGGAGDIITLGDGSDAQRDLARVPHHFELDGLIIRGDPERGQKRGIALNSADTTIRNSDIRDIKAVGQDSQAICGWNGPGPYVIENNYLEAAGENVMFGGAETTINGLVPSDITFRRNYLSKPLAWRSAESPWTVKNLFELKNARRVLVEGNVFEHNWAAGQAGYAILFTPINDGNAPWTVVSDVRLRLNVVRHVAAAINILGFDYRSTSQRTRRLEIRHNLFYDVDGSRWGGDGRFLLVGDEPADLVVDHNTVIQSGSILQLYGRQNGRPRPIDGLQLTNNLTLHNEYGIIGDETGVGRATIAEYLTREEIRGNVLAGANPALYPSGNLFPSVAELLGAFVDPQSGDYRLRAGNPFRAAATDGSMVGADVDAVMRAIPSRDSPGFGSPSGRRRR
jgi:Right handed beta helix region